MKEKTFKYRICSESTSAKIIPNALHIEATSQIPDNEFHLLAEAAIKDGYSLIHGLPEIEDWRYLDTPKNRTIIASALKKYPRYNIQNWPHMQEMELQEGFLRAYDLMLSDDGKSVEAIFECWFDVNSFLGIDIEAIEKEVQNDVWVNFFADYNPNDNSLSVFFIIDDNLTHDKLYYDPTENEKALIINEMEKASQKEFEQTLKEFVSSEEQETYHPRYTSKKDSLLLETADWDLLIEEDQLPFMRNAIRHQYAHEMIYNYLSTSRPELISEGISDSVMDKLAHMCVNAYMNNECIIECCDQILEEVCEDVDCFIAEESSNQEHTR